MESSTRSLILTILTVAGVIASALVLAGGLRASQGAATTPPVVSLPAGCVKPPGGFLIIQSQYGYNDSIIEGASPNKAWPVITVQQGQTVNITVCNIDKTQSHGFQISNYYDGSVVAVGPGQVLHVPAFVADKAGTFQIYCAIFCSIHLFMQYGQLRVAS
jgi:FtsP/CotA-like multicopper oxidase with cupredoxin domain